MTMGPFGWTLLLYCLGTSIGLSRALTCSHAQCDYDNVIGKADCTSLNLDCIPINYPNAAIMDLSHNNISELAPGDFHGFSRLTELYLDYNNISDVTSLLRSNALGSLQRLSVQHNILSDLPSKCRLSNLTDLAVDYNLITHLSYFPRCTSLQRFTADANWITVLDLTNVIEGVCGLVSLRFNQLRRVDLNLRHRPYFVFLSCQGRKLLLDYNEIRSVRITNMQRDGHHFMTDQISLSNNLLKRFSLDSLPIELNLASNGLQHWDNFQNHQRRNELKRLDVSNNSFDSMILPIWADGIEFLNADTNLLANLSSTTLSGFVYLTELHVANNRLLFISPTALGKLSKLQSLYLDDNALRSLFGGVFINQSDLVELSITNNLLTMLHPDYFIGLVSLKHLYLAGNQLTSVNSQMFKRMPQILTINLSQNELQNVDLQDCALNLLNLKNLSLAHNLIHDTVTILGDCDNLGTLDLSFNLIQVVPGQSLSGRNRTLSNLELEGNPLQCDCRLTGLRDWLSNTNSPPYIEPRCEGPTRHHGSVITDLDIRDFSCEPPKVKPDEKDLSAVVGQTATLTCTATGVPAPKITWLSPNGTEIPHEWQGRFAILQERILHITPVEKSDQGIFTCLAVNVLGEMDRAVVNVTVTNPTPIVVLVSIIFVTVAIALASVGLAVFLRRSYKKREAVSTTPQIQSANLKVGFRKGATIDTDEVCATLDEEYEIPNAMKAPGNPYKSSRWANDPCQIFAQTYEEPNNEDKMEEGEDDEMYETVSAPR